MRWVTFVLVGVLAGCGGKDETGKSGQSGAAQFAAAQGVVDAIAKRHPEVKRLTLHAVPAGKSGAVQLASTMATRRGKPSDPEDLEALRTGKEVVLDEKGALDVTVPILVADGKPGAVTGVTLEMPEGSDREALIAEARAIAAEVEKEVRAAGKPLW
jgi:hypothetical protein